MAITVLYESTRKWTKGKDYKAGSGAEMKKVPPMIHEPLKCSSCDFQAKNEHGLRIHSSKHK